MKNVNTFLKNSLARTVMLAVVCLTAISGYSQTLVQGDISIVAFTANPTKGFAFVSWVALEPGTKITFSENGFNDYTKASTATNNVRWRKPYGIWENTTGATIAAGTVITLIGETESHGTYEIYTVTGATSATAHTLSNSAGGHLFVYQGGTPPTVGADQATFNGTLIFGLGYQSTSGGSTWLTTTAATSGNSNLPSDLSVGNSIYLSSNANIGQYTGLRSGQSTLASYKAMVSNTANWTTGSAAAALTYNSTAFTAGAAATINSHPSNSTICAGANTTFTVAASNAVSYQWEVSTNGGGSYSAVSGGVYSGATTTTLTITGATAGMNAYMYRCAVTGTNTTVTNSNAATLTVNSAPSITTNPGNATICAGGSTSFSASVSNATSYRWYVNTGSGFNPINNGGVYSGATTTTLNLTGPNVSYNGYQYRLVATGGCSPDATSTSATLIVNSASSISAHPQSSGVCSSGNTSFSVTAANAVNYQWQVNSGSGYTNITDNATYSGANTSILNLTGVNASLDGNLYRVIVSGLCTPNATSSGALLQVDTPPAFLVDPQNEALCEGDNVAFSVFASSANTYQWQVNDGGGFVNISDNGTYSGATSSTLSVTGATLAMNGYTYRAIATGTCSPNATSGSSTLTVYALVTYYFDNDGDGYGDPFFTTSSCTGTPFMFVANNLDCNDYDNTIYPFAPEICGDGVDNDCDGDTDEDCVPTTQISSADCGSTINYVALDLIEADPVVDAQDYEFRIFDGASYIVATESSTDPSVTMSQFVGYEYGMTYDIDVRVKVDGVWGNWGPSCNISIVSSPYSEIQASQCATTLAAINTNIYAYAVPDATYRFRVTNGANVQTLDKSVRVFNLGELASYAYNTTYSIDVALFYDGSWTAYGPACNVTSPAAPTTQIQASQCGTTLAALSTTISANSVFGATQYRFRVTNGANVQTIDRPTRSFALTQLASYANSTTYSIDVAVEAGGSFGPYGSACNITTPAALTQVEAGQCGSTLTSIGAAIYANSVAGATQYRFRVVNGANVQTIDRTVRSFAINQLASYAYGTTYTIDVATEVGGSWSAYGTACNVTTPTLTTKVQASQCGITLASVATAINADNVAGATQYRFRVTNGANTQVIDRPTRSFSLTQLASYATSTTYTIDVAVEANGSFGAYGPACNVTTPALTTKVQASQCGTTLASVATAIYADNVSNATQYRFRVVNGANVQTIDRSVRSFSLNQLATYATSTTYTIDVAVQVNGNWEPYGAACNVTTPAITTQVQASQCGTTVASAGTAIYADNVSAATQYRFRVVNGANVQTIDKNVRYFSFTQLASYANGTTYTIDVAVMVNGSWEPYGSACNVSTPSVTTQVQSSQCGADIPTIGTAIYANNVPSATMYRFRVINGANVQTIDRAVRSFALTQLTTYAYNTTYTIDVAVQVDGSWGPYGPACNIATPTEPITKLEAAYCDVTIPSFTTPLYAIATVGAEQYRFEVTNLTTSAVSTIDKTARTFSLSEIGGITASTTYEVRVAVKHLGTWRPYGGECTVTTGASVMANNNGMNEHRVGEVAEVSFDAVTFPNPFATGFGVSVSTDNTEMITVTVYDMAGKVLESHTATAEELNNVRMGEGYAVGVYQVRVIQGTESKTLKVVKN